MIAGAMLLIIGPILWLAPSPRERQLARLRTQALTAGLKVQANFGQHNGALQQRLVEHPALPVQGWTRYSLIKQVSQPARSYEHVGPPVDRDQAEWWLLPESALASPPVEQHGAWRWQPAPGTDPRPTAELLAALEDWQPRAGHILAVSVASQITIGRDATRELTVNVAVVWDERGSSADLEQITARIQRLIDAQLEHLQKY
jgi:hypothetical protein